eukprot:2448829-Pyramimonas_sp.AAC.1
MAMGVKDEDAQKAAKKELEEKEKELREMGDYRTARSRGDKQTARLMAQDFADKWSDDMQLFNVCRGDAGWGAKMGFACSRGLAFPEKLWRQRPRPQLKGAPVDVLAQNWFGRSSRRRGGAIQKTSS